MKKHPEIQIEEEALFEIEDTYYWYESKTIGLGKRFKDEVDLAFQTIRKFPNGYAKIGIHRQFPMKNFPFVIIFEVTKTIIYIDAVFHTSQNPKKKNKV